MGAVVGLVGHDIHIIPDFAADGLQHIGFGVFLFVFGCVFWDLGHGT